MDNSLYAPLTVMAAVVALGLAYVVVPVALSAYRKLRGTKIVACPATGTPAEIELDAVGGAVAAATGHGVVCVAGCSHWPEHEHCGQECLAQLRAEGGARAA